MSMKFRLLDEYGQATNFNGEKLLSDTTDDGRKRSFVDMTIYRTHAGAYIVHRVIRYRIRHLSDRCSNLGDNLMPRDATDDDTVPCGRCNPNRVEDGGFGVEDRSQVLIATTPARLAEVLADHNTGVHSGFSRAMLADLSDIDPAIAAVWMEVTVP